MSATTSRTVIDFDTTLIRDLVEQYPQAMPILADAGMDLCCGGGHTVPEAAKLHGVDGDTLIAAIVAAIDAGVA